MQIPSIAKLNTIKSVLIFSSGDLERRTGLSHSDVDILVAAASAALLRHSVRTTALQLYREKQDLPNHGQFN